MQPFDVHTGRAVPLRRANIDTDQIIPAVYLKRITRTGFAGGLFEAWRQDPDFVLNQPVYAGASILVAGPNFGTGSSRQHAVWALLEAGFRVVLSSRFADIFLGNAASGGLLAARLAQTEIETLWDRVEAAPESEVVVDLDACEVRDGDWRAGFEIDPYTRWRLLEGLDDIDLTLRHSDAIGDYERRRAGWLPSLAAKPEQPWPARPRYLLQLGPAVPVGNVRATMPGVHQVEDPLAAELRAARTAVEELNCDPAERDRWRARLITITNAAKRDPALAQRRLDRFRVALDARVTESETAPH